jgi:Berberine and berberine like
MTRCQRGCRRWPLMIDRRGRHNHRPRPPDHAVGASRRFGAAVEPFASCVYVNLLADEGETGVCRACLAGKLARLAALKRHYDPDNVFHLNQNIRPER